MERQFETQNTANNIGDQEVYGTLRFRRRPGNITATSQETIAGSNARKHWNKYHSNKKCSL